MSQENQRSIHSSVDRRGFFRKVLVTGLDKLEKAGQALSHQLDLFEHLETPAGDGNGINGSRPNSIGRRYLRPPGALPESQFAYTCSSCGECVQACPANCIQLADISMLAESDQPHDTALLDDTHEPIAGGLPYIVPGQSPCVVCDDLSCMKACPSGALKLVDQVEHINMGLAVVEHALCLRGASGGNRKSGDEDCTLCVVACPLGDAAIGLEEQGLIEIRADCIGCGVCEHVCPTDPPSVWIAPN